MLSKVAQWDKNIDNTLQLAVKTVRYFLLLIMIVYLFFSALSMAGTLWNSLLEQNFIMSTESVRSILTDFLLVLIILAIIRTLFITNGFDYALAFLEIGFVVLVRKLLLIQTTPEEAGLLLVLGIVSALLFGLIIIIYHLKHRWKLEKEACLEEKPSKL
jgi:uncharacterized membrane protein (DUF373 family)